jgi:Putative zinc-finger
MDCAGVDLVGYHFGVLPEADRDAAEEHVKTCRACLDAYLALKRHEDGAKRGPRPSETARLRLRREVAATFGPRKPRPFAWLVRPFPLYQGLALVATSVVLAVTVQRTSTVPSAAPVVLEDGPSIDSARPQAQSSNVY